MAWIQDGRRPEPRAIRLGGRRRPRLRAHVPTAPTAISRSAWKRGRRRWPAALDTREVHGYLPEFGYRIFTEAAMRTGQPGRPHVDERGRHFTYASGTTAGGCSSGSLTYWERMPLM